jgi:hypothetical protein
MTLLESISSFQKSLKVSRRKTPSITKEFGLLSKQLSESVANFTLDPKIPVSKALDTALTSIYGRTTMPQMEDLSILLNLIYALSTEITDTKSNTIGVPLDLEIPKPDDQDEIRDVGTTQTFQYWVLDGSVTKEVTVEFDKSQANLPSCNNSWSRNSKTVPSCIFAS